MNTKCLKLTHYGFRGPSHDQFENHLTSRSQRIKYRCNLSSLTLECGAPQGFLPEALLFVLCISDLPKYLLQSQISMYVDDTVIYAAGLGSDNIQMTI